MTHLSNVNWVTRVILCWGVCRWLRHERCRTNLGRLAISSSLQGTLSRPLSISPPMSKLCKGTSSVCHLASALPDPDGWSCIMTIFFNATALRNAVLILLQLVEQALHVPAMVSVTWKWDRKSMIKEQHITHVDTPIKVMIILYCEYFHNISVWQTGTAIPYAKKVNVKHFGVMQVRVLRMLTQVITTSATRVHAARDTKKICSLGNKCLWLDLISASNAITGGVRKYALIGRASAAFPAERQST